MEDKKAVIARTAAELFLNQGYRKTSMKKLGEAAGMHSSGIYYYFKNKEEIRNYIYDTGETLFWKDVVGGGIDGPDVELRIKTIINNTISNVISSREIVLFVLENFPSKKVNDNEKRKIVVIKGFHFFRDALKKLAESKGIDPINSSVAAFCLVAMMFWVYKWYNPKGRLGIEEITDHVTRLFLSGFYSGEVRISEIVPPKNLLSEFTASWEGSSDKKETVANTAARLFLEEGYENITLEKLGEVMKFQPSAIYHYFKSKEDILTSIVDKTATDFNNYQSKYLQNIDDKENWIKTIINDVTSSLARFDGLALLVFQYLPSGNFNTIRNKKTKDFFNTVRNTLSDLIKIKHIRNFVDPTVATFCLIAMTTFVYKWYKPHGPLTLPEISDQITRLFFHGFYQDKHVTNDSRGYHERIRQINYKGAKYGIGKIGNDYCLIGGKCQACGQYFSHVTQECASCRGRDVRKVALGSRGRIVNYNVIIAPSIHAEYSCTHPLAIAQVELPEKVCVLGVVTNIDDARPVKVGDEAELYFYSAGLDENGMEVIAFAFRLQLEQA